MHIIYVADVPEMHGWNMLPASKLIIHSRAKSRTNELKTAAGTKKEYALGRFFNWCD